MIDCCLQVKFDFIADFYVIVITPLLVAGVVVGVGFARAARQPEKRSKFAYVHGSLLLLGTFLVLPATSMKVRVVWVAIVSTLSGQAACYLLVDLPRVPSLPVVCW